MYINHKGKIEQFFSGLSFNSLKYKIDRHGSFLAFFSWVPLIGDILTLSLGFFRVNFKAVAFWILIGKLTRFIVLALLIYNGIKIVN